MAGTMKVVRGISCGRAVILLLAVWLGFLLLAVSLLRHEPDPQVNQRISQALRDLQSLHQQRHEINKLIYEYSLGGPGMKQEEKSAFLKNLRERVQDPINSMGMEGSMDCKDGPPAEYEKTRRRLKASINEMWYYMNSELRKIHKELSLVSPQIATKVNKVIQGGLEHKRSLIRDVTMLPKIDGYASWRENEAADLSDLVQRRLETLQNPPDCPNARKLVCSLNKGCGYGCQLHHATYCLLVAYGTERTLVLKSKGWRYNRGGWEKVFKPLSDVCTDIDGALTSNWPGSPNAQVVMLGIVDNLVPRPPYLPLAVPKDLAPRIARLHGDPSVWWVGQFLRFLLRPQQETSALLATAAAKFNFKGPVVGVHIRRTDKVGTEAAFHTVDEYMHEVEEYFRQLSLMQKVDKKRIYLASDDPKVFADIQNNYSDYEVFGDPQIAKTAAVATRYTDNSLNGIIMDIHFLSRSDFLVCTFSSQVCRVAYEIMQALHVDAADRFRSLDDIYYYGGQGIHRKIALLSHKAETPDQIDLEVGDTVGVAGNHWNGFSKGKNLRTNQVGLYPTFKVDDVIEAVDFPTYPQVPLSVPRNNK